MISNSITGNTRLFVPTFADIQRRRAELLGMQAQLEPESSEADLAPPPTPEPHPAPAELQLGEAALHGIAGLAVRTLAPHTEAHPAAILLQLLAAFGNAVGSGPHCMVDATRHALNLFVVLVGESSKARKGTSWNQVRRLFSELDPHWAAARISTALLTPSGLMYSLRDQPSPTDRRLLVLAEEFAAVLHTLSRAKGRLSPLLRSAWDNGHLRTLEGRQLIQATATHISLIAHITERELAQHLHPTEAHNGFANRCLWTSVQRSKCLPDGGSLGAHECAAIAAELRRALDWASSGTSILFRRADATRELWHDCYPALSQARPGLYGAATSRAEAQVLRLSAIYSALDCSPIIEPPHLQAALAVWEYCCASASRLFGTSTGDPIADRIRQALDAAPEGLSRKQIRALFHGHLGSQRIEAALENLMSLGAVSRHTASGRGRPSTLWSALSETESMETEQADGDIEANNGQSAHQEGT